VRAWRRGAQLAAFGLTAACDADLRRDSFAGYAEADASGVLGLRIYGLVVHDQVDWLLGAGLRGRRSGRLAAEAVKIWADGGMSSRTAAIHGSYPVPPYGSGILYFERDQLTEMVREFDAPVITADPRLGMRDAVLRRTGAGRVLGPGEQLTARDALAMYTTQAAFAARREDEIGSLEPGKLADFAVLDRNPLSVEPERITDIQVVATVMDGTPVYQSGDVFPGG
jgi:predicted amidohydrolase YtcJ